MQPTLHLSTTRFSMAILSVGMSFASAAPISRASFLRNSNFSIPVWDSIGFRLFDG